MLNNLSTESAKIMFTKKKIIRINIIVKLSLININYNLVEITFK